jgi:hypothetical protein
MVHVDGIDGGFWPAEPGPYVTAFGQLEEAALHPGKPMWALRMLGEPNGVLAVRGALDAWD